MCKFCDKNICEDYNIATQNEPYIGLYLENYCGEVIIRAYGDNTASYVPKYCPECGRRINTEERGE